MINFNDENLVSGFLESEPYLRNVNFILNCRSVNH